ncbi:MULTISPECIES: carboxymuconolactone decarboxylase family protein [unclassified Streptomyces]|uniref:carboxymuconolactone decarboxylase family protein n=1 Tax=unclassified Streptomyces TaxID=2593676 RepID=UPI00194085D4
MIAVAVAHLTQCPYCVQGHTRLARRKGAEPQETMGDLGRGRGACRRRRCPLHPPPARHGGDRTPRTRDLTMVAVSLAIPHRRDASGRDALLQTGRGFDNVAQQKQVVPVRVPQLDGRGQCARLPSEGALRVASSGEGWIS